MLQELSIQNLALIENLTLNFKSGFTTLTGETGAGKSILLDALGLALGDRADSALVRFNTPRADVSAQFDISALPQVQHWLQENDLDDDDLCLLRRTVTIEGRSKAYINGRPAPASSLKELGNLLIDIHGQHEHQSLLSSLEQLHLLDAYAQHPTLLNSAREHYQHWQQLKRHLTQLQTEQSDFQSKSELLNFQKREFDEIKPKEGEFESLSEEQSQLSHANEIKQACELGYFALEGEQGATDQLQRAIHALEEIVEYSPGLQNVIDQLNSALIDIQEAASETQHLAERIELDPQLLAQVDERLHNLFALAKKYHLEPEQLVSKHQQILADLANLEHSDIELENLQKQIEQAGSAYQQAAKALQHSRQQAAGKLGQIVTDGMQHLGMPNGHFEIQLSAAPASATGIDKVEFMVSANKGQPLQPLAKVASGGELSRISLAIQVATSEVASLPTLIFDEVDVGIGGGIAEVVGKKMQQLGAHKQILSITHLAQVASHGHQHWKIEKQTIENNTFTQVSELSENERVAELARMMGGLKVTEQTLNHAAEMLQEAQKTA
jgi:DNA repair protein RecN (Recombination protein N)